MTNSNTNGLVYVNAEYYSYTQPLPFFRRLFLGGSSGFAYCKNCQKWVDMYDRMIGIAVTDEVLYERNDSDLIKKLQANDWGVLDTTERVHDWVLQPAVFIGLGRCESCDGPFTVLGEVHGKASNKTIYYGGIFIMEIDKASALILLEKSIIKNLLSNNKRYAKAMEFCKAICTKQEFSRIEATTHKMADANMLGASGMEELNEGNLDEAEINLSNALKIFVELDDLGLTAATYMNLGLVNTQKKLIGQAEDYFNKSLGLFEKINRKLEVAEVCGLLGQLYFDNRDYFQAEKFFSKSVEVGRALANRPLMAIGLQSLGSAYLNQDKREQAKKTYSEALIMCQEIRDRSGIKKIEAILTELNNQF